MGRTTLLDEPDLDERLSEVAARRLEGLDGGIDSEFVVPEKNHTFYFYRYPRQPKAEIPEHTAIARKKAQQARAIINKQRKREPTIKEYDFDFLKIYFMKNPDAQPGNILQVIREIQRRRESGTYVPGTEGYNNVMELFERRLKEYK